MKSKDRIKELNCLYGLSRLAEKQDISLEELFEGVLDLILQAWQYPEITCARITLNGRVFKTNRFKETIWKQDVDLIVHGYRTGSLEVFYLKEKPERDEGPFLKEERTLLQVIANRLVKFIEKKETEEKLRAQYKGIPIPTYTWQKSGRDFILINYNDAAMKITNGGIDKFVGKTFTEMFGDKLEDVEAIQRCFREKSVIRHEGLYYLRTRQENRHFMITFAFVPPDLVLVHTEDIDKRKRAEKRLQESEKKYRSLYSAMKEGMALYEILYEESGKVIGYKLLDINSSYETIFGLKKAKVIGHKASEIYPDVMSAHFEIYTKVAISGQPASFETYFPSLDKYVAISIFLPQPGQLATLCNDITAHKKMEEELQKIQKLESVGILAGGIAHDFNNLLTCIIGNLSLVELYAKTGSNIFEVLEEIKKASNQARRLTKQLITFAKGGLPIKKKISVAKLLKDTTCFCLTGSIGRYEFSIPEALWWAELDEGQINQAISNLIINADQASPGGGVIEVSAENVIIKAEHNLPLDEGRYVKISVKDQGIGIPKEYLNKIFDPYFTTKSKGSGFGLAVAYSIIKKHNGYITVESTVGVGTTFTIWLPALGKKISRKGIKDKLYPGRGRILFMDDQQGVRDTALKILTCLGYEVEFAKDGAEAVELYKNKKESGPGFDVVILDLTVPGGMGGREAIQKIYEIDHKVKAIVSSGYSNDPVISDYKQYGFKGVITKPYDIKELSEVLYKLINNKGKPKRSNHGH